MPLEPWLIEVVTILNLSDELLKCIVIWQHKLFSGFTLSNEAGGWVVVASAKLDAEVENIAQNTKGVIEDRRYHFLAGLVHLFPTVLLV